MRAQEGYPNTFLSPDDIECPDFGAIFASGGRCEASIITRKPPAADVRRVLGTFDSHGEALAAIRKELGE